MAVPIITNPSPHLKALLRSLEPTLNEGVYVYTTPPQGFDVASLQPVAEFLETEGLSIIVKESHAVSADLPILFRAAWITLSVHSELSAVGLTAAVSQALYHAGISCNVVAAANHDHLFVPVERALDAMDVLKNLQSQANTQTVSLPSPIPMLSYEDGVAAMEWLQTAFGFREVVRMLDSQNRLAHGELEAGGGKVMLASPSPNYVCPKRRRLLLEAEQKCSELPWIFDGTLVYVENLDTHFQQALTSGAVILGEIEEGFPGRRYRAEDPEGHRWFFFEGTNNV